MLPVLSRAFLHSLGLGTGNGKHSIAAAVGWADAQVLAHIDLYLRTSNREHFCIVQARDAFLGTRELQANTTLCLLPMLT